jgi:hypothetical protein
LVSVLATTADATTEDGEDEKAELPNEEKTKKKDASKSFLLTVTGTGDEGEHSVGITIKPVATVTPLGDATTTLGELCLPPPAKLSRTVIGSVALWKKGDQTPLAALVHSDCVRFYDIPASTGGSSINAPAARPVREATSMQQQSRGATPTSPPPAITAQGYLPSLRSAVVAVGGRLKLIPVGLDGPSAANGVWSDVAPQEEQSGSDDQSNSSSSSSKKFVSITLSGVDGETFGKLLQSPVVDALMTNVDDRAAIQDLTLHASLVEQLKAIACRRRLNSSGTHKEATLASTVHLEMPVDPFKRFLERLLTMLPPKQALLPVATAVLERLAWSNGQTKLPVFGSGGSSGKSATVSNSSFGSGISTVIQAAIESEGGWVPSMNARAPLIQSLPPGINSAPFAITSCLDSEIGTVRVSRQKFTIEDAIGSHVCSLEASWRVTNGIPLG